MNDEINVGADVPAPETAAPASPEPAANQTQNTELSLDEALEASYEKSSAEPNIDDEPVTPAETQETKAEGESTEAKQDSDNQSPNTKEAEQESDPAIEPPTSWSKEVREHWKEIPRATQEYIANRELESHRAISQLGQHVKALEPVQAVLTNNRDLFEGRGVSFDEGVTELINAQRTLNRDPIGGIKWLADSYGVDLGVFANADSDGDTQTPMVASLQNQLASQAQQIEQMNQLVMSREEREQRAYQSTAEQELSEFMTERQIDEATAEAMVDRVTFYTERHPEMSFKHRLEKAHDDTMWTDPDRRQALIEKQTQERTENEAKMAHARAEKAKKAGSVNVKSSPVNAKNSITIDDALESKWAELQAS